MTNAEILARFRECKRLAEEGEPLSPDERAEFRSSIARQKAEDDAARAETSPQGSLLLA